MKHTRTVLLCSLLLLVVATPRLRAQTADEIVSKHITAMGGKDKMLSIKTVYLEATAVMQNGTEITTKTYKVKDKLYRQEINFGMGSVVIIVTPSKGWASSPRTNGEFKPLPDEQLKALQGQMDPAPLVDYAAKGGKIELGNKDTVGGKECYVVKLTSATGQETSYSFDEQTYYVTRESRKGGGMMAGGGGAGAGGGAGGGRRPGGDGMMNIDFSDYQKTADGFVIPYTMVAGGFGAKSSVEKAEINKTIDEVSLSKP